MNRDGEAVQRCGLVAPLSDGVESRLVEHWVDRANDLRLGDASILVDDDGADDGAFHTTHACKAGVPGGDALHENGTTNVAGDTVDPVSETGGGLRGRCR